MEAQQKWAIILSELESSISNIGNDEDCKVLLNRFELIDEEFRNQEQPQIYMKMWRIALRAGKLKLANSYAKKSLQYLISFKRIPQIKIFLNSLKEVGLLKNETNEFYLIEEILLGKLKNVTHKELKNINYFVDHPEHWKQFPEFLQQYLNMSQEWNLEEWTLCYEYILLNHFDKDIFILIMDKAHELKDEKVEKNLSELFKTKKIRIPQYQDNKKNKSNVVSEKLNINYDQVAMELLSGEMEPNDQEQKRVISSLKYITEEEFQTKGQDMIVAFELLGMEQVVFSLCEKIVSITQDVKQKASTYYVWAQALNNNGDYYKSIDLIDNVIQNEPLLSDERIAFLYLKAESYFKLNKIKAAKLIYLEVKQLNPQYRLVKERLRIIEST